MLIPNDLVERQQLYDDLTRQCLSSRLDRFSFYQTLRNYYLFGSPDNKGAPYNKIGSTVETIYSFIYSPTQIRFSIYLGTAAAPEDVYKAQVLAREINDQWRISRTHLAFGLALKWSFVFGCMIGKVLWKNGIARLYLVEPHQFGVLREDCPELADQEAFCMCYTITRTQLEEELEGNPRKESILHQISRGGEHETPRNYAEGLSRLIIGGPVKGVAGSVAIGTGGSYIEGGLSGGGRGPPYNYAPKVETELLDMLELFVWDSKIEEYRCVTVASGVTIYDRPASKVGYIKGAAPFVVIRPEVNLYDYFFGDSFVARVSYLQDWRTERTMQVKTLLEKQVNPPQAIIGGAGISEEKLLALRRASGQVSFPTPNTRVENLGPQMPPDIFKELEHIDSMFDDTAGIGHILQGKGESGVRSRGQADLMARLGSSRPKERAVVAEESAQDVANLMLRCVQENSKQRFEADLPGGRKLTFIAEQFTKDYEVLVDAHSSSPIFVEDRKHDAMELFNAHAIDRDSLLEMFDPPNLQHLKARVKLIEQGEAQEKQAELAAEAQGGGKGHLKRVQ